MEQSRSPGDGSAKKILVIQTRQQRSQTNCDHQYLSHKKERIEDGGTKAGSEQVAIVFEMGEARLVG